MKACDYQIIIFLTRVQSILRIKLSFNNIDVLMRRPPPPGRIPVVKLRKQVAFVTHEIIFSLFVNDCELHLICTSSEFNFLNNAADGHRKLLGPCDILHLHKYLTETHFFTRKFLSKSDTPKQTYLKIICICFFMTTWWVFLTNTKLFSPRFAKLWLRNIWFFL